MKAKDIIRKVVVPVLLCVIVFCLIRIYTYNSSTSKQQDEFEALKNLTSGAILSTNTPAHVDNYEYVWGVPNTVEPTINPAYTGEPTVDENGDYVVGPVNPSESSTPAQSQDETVRDYDILKNLNNDYVGWLTVPGTNVDYPVMQTNNSPDYYLRKSFYKKYSNLGTPYVEEGCDVEAPSDMLTIYGHHIKDGKIFGSLENFKKQNYYKNHKYITFDTRTYTAKYEIVAVYKSVVYTGKDDEFKYWDYIDFKDEDDFNSFMEIVNSKKLYDTDKEAEYGDKLISLSTCEYSATNGRLIVMAKMIEKTEKPVE